MMPDLSNLFNFQLAMIGIVLVAGLFYLWRLIARVESRIDELATAMEHLHARQAASSPIHIAPTSVPASAPVSASMSAEDQEAEEFMKEVFGSVNHDPIFIPTYPTPSSVQIEEIESTPTEAPPAPPSTATEDAPSLSKTKLQKMSLEALKKLAREKLLSSEGTRADLIKRILSTMDASDTQE